MTDDPTRSTGPILPDWLEYRAHASPDRLALVAHGRAFTFAELDRWATRVAEALRNLEVTPGDRVAVLLRNSPTFAAIVHAAARAGIVLVPINTRLSPSEIAWQLADVGPRLLIFDGPNTSLARAALAEVTWLRSVDAGVFSPGDLTVPATLPEAESGARISVATTRTIDLSAVHTIVYTSGTTGRPKGAMLTFGNHWWSAIGSVLNLGLVDGDRWLAVLPLFHVGGLSILMRSAIYGIPAIVHESFDPVAVNRAIDHEGITIVSVVSTMLRRMLDERGSRSYPPTLRCVLLGGGPAPRPLLDDCARRGVPVIQTYGLTETASQVTTLAPSDALRKLGSAGKPLLPTAVRILSNGEPAAVGEAGEIVVRGPTVTIGYWKRPDDTARAIRDGWLYTGDLGYLDDEGYLYVVDRRADLIISGGENVYPAEVEAVLLAHADVVEAGVVGIPDAQWGQVPIAFVRMRPGAEVREADLLRFCSDRLARYKVPKEIRFVDELPRNATGKLLRHALRDQVACADRV